MNSRLFWTVFLALVSAGIVLHLFIRWRVWEEERRASLRVAERRRIGFAAEMAGSES